MSDKIFNFEKVINKLDDDKSLTHKLLNFGEITNLPNNWDYAYHSIY